jgi:hypothetical protein
MAAFTTIAAATVAIGGNVAKGIIAGDAASSAARQAGRLNLEKDKLEKEAVAALEQNFYDALRANTDIYDKQLQTGNAMGAQILEAVQEGDQRGVAAGAGKVKQIQDATLGATADKFAAEQSEIGKLRAAAGEASARDIASLKDGRAAAKGVQADALTQQASDLEGKQLGSYIDAGVSALKTTTSLLSKNAMGKAAQKLVDDGKYTSLSEATKALGGLGNSALRKIARGGDFISGLTSTVNDLASTDNDLTSTDNDLTSTVNDFTKNKLPEPSMFEAPEMPENPFFNPAFNQNILKTFNGFEDLNIDESGYLNKLKSIYGNG